MTSSIPSIFAVFNNCYRFKFGYVFNLVMDKAMF